jgi:hypothetical protein
MLAKIQGYVGSASRRCYSIIILIRILENAVNQVGAAL